eukprot:CAMPEP_0202958192 /NCGR_PEP_ID=MMETSP1396-20130829/2552_1 /ASSEMBLY_ACC=CAM_ASM_000872 /TAXON_ID= /ORGANISM="Pseudokeronopsis sp., Strain Brazil" /LENGTH=158 /DNA_ID=CAMNT_0049676115 /DNA_START=64 /DNA_END=540 /DNA_ORIENTATION=-
MRAIDSAIQKGSGNSEAEWDKMFSSIKPGDVQTSASPDVGRLLKALTYTNHYSKSHTHSKIYGEIDEYFRKQFRKIDSNEALHITTLLAEDATLKLSCLDDKFWVWETIEEALRPKVDQLTDEGVEACLKAFSFNYKGSEEFMSVLFQRIIRHTELWK